MLANIENRVRQQLFGMISLFVVGLMVLNSLGLLVYGATNQTNLTFNVASGAFTIANVPTQMSFAGQTYGTGNNVTGNVQVDLVAVTDYRGTGSAWSAVVNANDLSDGTNTIYANKLKLYQDVNGVLTNVENCTTSRVLLGSNGNLANAGVILMNTSSSPGIIRYDNGYFNLTLGGSESAGQYAAKIIFTLT